MASSVTKKIRVLALHGFRQNAARLKHQMSTLLKRLERRSIEFTFLDAPFLYVSPTPLDEKEKEDVKKYGPYRQWWTTNRSILLEQKTYDTARESVAFVESFLFTSPVKFDAIFAFSQGGSVLQFVGWETYSLIFSGTYQPRSAGRLACTGPPS